MNKDKIYWTGERFIPSLGSKMPVIYLEHFNRYYMAKSFCGDNNVLDVGSGEGYGCWLLSLTAKSVNGIDIDPAAVQHASCHYRSVNLQYSCKSALETGFDENQFDVVTCFEMLEHIGEQEELLAEVDRVLKNDGLFLVSTPNKMVHQNEYHSENPFHVKELYFDEFKALMESRFGYCGFYSQRVCQTAKIWAMDKTTQGKNRVAVIQYNDNKVETDIYEMAPAFHICVCSHTPLPELKDEYELVDISFMEEKLFKEAIERLESQVKDCIAKVYFSENDSFDENNVMVFDYRHDGYFADVSFKFKLPRGTRAFRIDPINSGYCIVKEVSVCIGDMPIQAVICNKAFAAGLSIDCFETSDPWYIYNINYDTDEYVFVKYSILINSAPSFTWELKKIINDFSDKEKKLHSLNNELEATRNQLLNEIVDLKNINAQINEQFSDAVKINSVNRDLLEQIDEMKVYIENKNFEVNMYLQSTSWKITKPLRIIRLKSMNGTRLIKKGFVSLEANGFKTTWKLIKERRKRKKNSDQFKEKLDNEKADTELSPYDSVFQYNEDFSPIDTDIKLLTFYLPQFHSIPENDKWWGEGFTEWHNTKKAAPRFKGHYQPRTPHKDIGYYNLSDMGTLKKQVKLANEHGVYGFCFYYYWFSGKRLLEKPVDMLLEHPEIDIHFCLCWANENWTRTWDGLKNDILMKQDYSDEDNMNFIKDMAKYIADPRYIRVKNKPVILVYNPGEIPNAKKTFESWRHTAKELNIGEILIWTCQTCNNTAELLRIEEFVDAEVQFPPHNVWHEFLGVKDIDLKGKEAGIYNYQYLVKYLKTKTNENENSKLPVYRTCMLGWDNSSRKDNGWITFYAYSLESYYDWLASNISYTRKNFDSEDRFVFINAWNEWAEGTYLEPDERYGYAGINTTTRALLGYSFHEMYNAKVLKQDNGELICFDDNGDKPRIAVHVHLFYTECVDEIIKNINAIPYRFDCFISTDTNKKRLFIEEQFLKNCNAESIHVMAIPNHGRDVLPFLIQMRESYYLYDFICHIHSKKTSGQDHGDLWRDYLYNNLLGTSEHIKILLNCFLADSTLGLVFPEIYPPLKLQAEWGGNKGICERLLEQMGIGESLPSEPVFPVGNMFWARSDAIGTFFNGNISSKDFPPEQGQVNATAAHAIERLWIYIAKANGFNFIKTHNFVNMPPEANHKRRAAFYVHYDASDIVTESDIEYLKSLSKCAEELIFISNSSLSQTQIQKIKPIVSNIIIRKNEGYDFGAWKDALVSYGFNNLASFDEVVLANNSCYAPVYDLGIVFQKMNNRNVDFWGITLFPSSVDGSYLDKKNIDEHIQSYFMVFNKNVVESSAFQNFWMNMIYPESWKETVADYESNFTKKLKDSGFRYDILVRETRFMPQYLYNYAIPYEMPYCLLILGSPFIKKKYLEYAINDEKYKLSIFLRQIEITYEHALGEELVNAESNK